MSRRPIIALLMAAPALAVTGCVWYGPHSMTRLWTDRNTLNRPAVFLETLSHSPAPRERVERFRWQYGAGPGTVLMAPEQVLMAPPAPAYRDSVEGAAVPPPPPPEPAAATEPATRRRSGVAWMFGSSRG